jgi:hypothetical protein
MGIAPDPGTQLEQQGNVPDLALSCGQAMDSRLWGDCSLMAEESPGLSTTHHEPRSTNEEQQP